MNVQGIDPLLRLRRLRERRADAELARQRQHCRVAAEAVERARAEADGARDRVEDEARQLQALLGAGALPVGRYREALELLDALHAVRGHFDAALAAADRELAERQVGRDAAQRALAQRQRQCEALQPLLAHQANRQLRDLEAAEEALNDERGRGRPEACR